jgi:hypothetical protein
LSRTAQALLEIRFSAIVSDLLKELKVVCAARTGVCAALLDCPTFKCSQVVNAHTKVPDLLLTGTLAVCEPSLLAQKHKPT